MAMALILKGQVAAALIPAKAAIPFCALSSVLNAPKD
jgi:hypothetical protein